LAFIYSLAEVRLKVVEKLGFIWLSNPFMCSLWLGSVASSIGGLKILILLSFFFGLLTTSFLLVR
jgi:hypothetical protein